MAAEGLTMEPVTTIYPTRDDAIAHAVHEAAAEGGGAVLVHAPACAAAPDGKGCTCAPEVHIVAAAEVA